MVDQTKPRVFVSSVMEDFDEFRQAAKRGIVAAGGEPVMIEDYPSLPHSSRNACLDAVGSSDIYVAIVGSRGGWKTPSGKLVVEEEYDEAKRLKKQPVIFIREVEHDEDAKTFIKKVSDYTHGVYRKKFRTSIELQAQVEESLRPLVNSFGNPKVEENIIEDILKKEYKILNQTSLRFALIPEREDQFIDPADLVSPDLEAQIIDIGTSSEVRLLSRRLRKDVEVGIDTISVFQISDDRGRNGMDEVKLELSSLGHLIIDTNVTGRRTKDHSADMSDMVILEDDITDALSKCFAFAWHFFNAKDQFRRYDRMLYNAALGEVGYKPLMREAPKGSSISMNMSGNNMVFAFEQPKVLAREDLATPTEETNRTLAMLRRRMEA